MRRRSRKVSVAVAGRPNSEINVTPLVDVVLVLLIIFMVVTPMLQRGKDVHLPKSQKTDDQAHVDWNEKAIEDLVGIEVGWRHVAYEGA